MTACQRSASGNVAVEGEVEEVEVVEETDDSDVVEAPLSESVAATGTGSGGGVTTTQINFREGPGLSYGIIRGLDTGERVEITGKDASGLWFKVLDGEGVDGWVYAQLIAVDPDVNVASLPVATAPPRPLRQPALQQAVNLPPHRLLHLLFRHQPIQAVLNWAVRHSAHLMVRCRMPA